MVERCAARDADEVVLSSFGFHAQAFWFPDTALLAIVFGVFTLSSYLVLEFLVKEKR